MLISSSLVFRRRDLRSYVNRAARRDARSPESKAARLSAAGHSGIHPDPCRSSRALEKGLLQRLVREQRIALLTYFRKRIEPFDFIYSSAAFKNFSESVEALDEMHRVLPPLGEAVVVDLGKDASLDEIDTYVKQSGRRRIDAWITKWTFRHVLLKRAYTRDEFIRMAAQSQLGICQIDCAPIGLEVRLTKPSRVGRESPNVFMVDRGTNVPSALVVAEA